MISIYVLGFNYHALGFNYHILPVIYFDVWLQWDRKSNKTGSWKRRIRSDMDTDNFKIHFYIYKTVYFSYLTSRHTIVCRAAQEAGAPHREYIDRKNENVIFTPLYLGDHLSDWNQICYTVARQPRESTFKI